MELAQRIEAILFWKGEPVAITALSKMLGVEETEVRSALTVLSDALKSRGVRLVTTDSEVSLATAPELSELIETLRKDEMKRDIGKAGAETLAIVLYRGPVSRSEIDYIRGVNSSFILRNLIMRGLIDRIANPKDERSFAYAITPALLAHLGVTHKEALPDYDTVVRSIDTFMQDQESASEQTSV